MIAYAVRAVPWSRIALAGTLIVLLMELVRWDPRVLWPLEGTAVGLLAGATAWCFDETAAVVVDVAPRGLAWRATARASGVTALASAWTGVVLHAGQAALFDHRNTVLVQGFAAMALGGAYACWWRARGEAVPGLLFASAVAPATTAWALVRPFDGQLVVFPYGTTSPSGWQLSAIAWAGSGMLALGILVAAVAEAPWWRRRGHRSPASRQPALQERPD